MSIKSNMRVYTLSALVFLCLATTGWASDPLPKPEEQVILTVSGKIGITNAGDSAEFDRAMLKDIGWRTLDTYTDWTDGIQEFAGVPLSDLLSRVDARGVTISAIALNDYLVDIPISDAEEYDVLLALENFGTPMSVREKGPIWVIYPSDEPGGGGPKPNNEKMIWQLRKLIVK